MDLLISTNLQARAERAGKAEQLRSAGRTRAIADGGADGSAGGDGGGEAIEKPAAAAFV
ncbi:hypothetical protein [Nonomuraea longicatena]|uniref:Uncharacterized protein n=1 Tax=Nonomuraea longicatena TaxID=83682 RepID=A0ABN1Q5H9_9ACTN